MKKNNKTRVRVIKHAFIKTSPVTFRGKKKKNCLFSVENCFSLGNIKNAKKNTYFIICSINLTIEHVKLLF